MLCHTNTEGDNVSLQMQASGGDGTLSYSASGLPAGLSINSSTGLIGGSVAYGDAQTQSGLYSVTVTANDAYGDSGKTAFNWTINAAPPIAVDDSYTVDPNATFSINAQGGVLANDSDPDKLPLSAVLASNPSDGSLKFYGDGSFTYTPNAHYTGTDSFTYYAVAGGQESNLATVTLNVQDSGTITTQPGSYSILHDQVLTVDADSGVLANDSDSDGDSLTVSPWLGPNDGSLQLNGDGSFAYTPDAGYVGTDSFTFQAFDGTSYSNVATATLTVPQDTPTAEPGDYSVLPSGTTSFTADDGVLAALPDNSPNWLTAELVSTTTYGSLTLNSDGSFSYTPGPNFPGNDSFTYEAYDGISYSAPATVTLTTLPVVPAQSYTVTHDQPLTVDAGEGLLLGAYDAESDPLTAQLVSEPSHGSVTVNSDGSFSYMPDKGYVGSDSFTFTASNGSQNSGPTIASIDVIDDVPLAGDSEYSTPGNQSLTVDAGNGVLANAGDDDGDSLTAQLVSGPSNGTLQFRSDGSFSYTPDPGFIGTDSFQYDATDGISTSDPAPVTITVNENIPETSTDSMPSAVAVADFNNDGYPDVALADQGQNTVSIYLDTSSGIVSSTPASTVAVGNAPVALAAGDFGNDQQDLAVANSGDNTVSILLGNGDGTFTTSQVIGVGSDPVSIAVGDFLGNGVVDLAVANKGSNTVSILQNNGSSVFSVVATLNVGHEPLAVGAGDLTGDGKDDLVVANSGDNTVSVLLNNGNGTFAPPVTYAVGSSPSSIAIGDFNGDGYADVAMADSGSNDVEILLGNGDGTFQTPTSYAVGSNPVSVVAGNFAGPGYTEADLAVVNEGSNSITVLSNNGGSETENESTLPTAINPRGMALGDFANDGQLQGVVVATAAPGNGQLAFVANAPAAGAELHTADYFKVQALKTVGIPQIKGGRVSIETVKEDIAINKKITAAYASLFAKNPNKFTWFGLAAFASVQVGQSIQYFATPPKNATALEQIPAKILLVGAAALASGNQAVYKDIYWQILAYEDGGLNQIKALNLGWPQGQLAFFSSIRVKLTIFGRGTGIFSITSSMTSFSRRFGIRSASFYPRRLHKA